MSLRRLHTIQARKPKARLARALGLRQRCLDRYDAQGERHEHGGQCEKRLDDFFHNLPHKCWTSLALCSKHGKHTMERPLDPIRLLTVICYARGLRVSTLEGQASVERQGLFLFHIESSSCELDVQVWILSEVEVSLVYRG